MELNSDLIMQFGLMQKLSTGNSLLDAILVMLLPLLFSKVVPHLQELASRWARRPVKDTVRREIAFTYKANKHFDYDDDVPPNHKLQTAILVHLNSLPGFQQRLVTADVKLVKAPTKKRAADQASQQDMQGGDASSSSSEADYYWYPDIELEEFEVKMVPPMDETITLQPGLTFCRTQKTATTGDGATKCDETTVTFTLASASASQIDDFIAAAYDSYREAIRGERITQGEEQRFLYLPVLSGAEGAKEGDFTFRAYPLTDEKDFDNFFHPEKDEILNLVEAFANKTGKFAIKGYPQKLGFLLHGPPGTGKTSFLRALASHTKRSIINIPLARIRTNQQLMSLMMDQTVRVEGDDYCRPLPHRKVIYVCEDVDAASHVVQKRGQHVMLDPVSAALSSIMARQPGPSKAWAHGAEGAAALTAQGGVAGALQHKGAAGDKGKAATTQADADVGLAAPKLLAGMGRSRTFLSDSGSDELNLAGLLNVLDGVVDTPGRLLVLTTNHPEMLDPALIRPGRINRKVYMGHMAQREALQLVSHYFGDITPQQREQLAAVWQDGVVSPAALESLCAECESVDSLVKGVSVLLSHADACKDAGDVIKTQGDDVDRRDQAAVEVQAGSSGCGEGGEGGRTQALRQQAGGCESSHADSCPDSSDAQAEGLASAEDGGEGLVAAACSSASSTSSSSDVVVDAVVQADAGVAQGKQGSSSNVVMLRASSCFAELARVFAADGTAAAVAAATPANTDVS